MNFDVSPDPRVEIIVGRRRIGVVPSRFPFKPLDPLVVSFDPSALPQFLFHGGWNAFVT